MSRMQCLDIPDQIIDDSARRACFPTTNALIEDPVAELAYEDSLHPWTAEEKRVFMDKFMAHPKVRCKP